MMKFQPQQASSFYAELKKEVDAYFLQQHKNRYANASLLFKSTLVVVGYALSYALILCYGDASWIWIPYFSMGVFGVLIVFNFLHDASHHAFFQSKKWNNRMRYVGDLAGINTYIWNIRHNVQHHTFTNVLGGDLIIEQITLIRLSTHQPYQWFHRYQVFYAPLLYMFYSLYWILVIDIKLFFKKEVCNLKHIHHSYSEWIKLILFKLVYISYSVFIPAWVTNLGISKALGCFLWMHVVAGLLLSVVAVLGHFVEGSCFPEARDGIIPNHWADHELEATIDFAPNSKCMHKFTGGLNTHTAHHLFPGICHTHYFNLTKIIQQYCERNHYPYHAEPFFDALKSHVRYLRKLSISA